MRHILNTHYQPPKTQSKAERQKEKAGRGKEEKGKEGRKEPQLTRRVEGRVIRGKTIRRQSPVPGCRGLEIPGLLAAILRLSIRRGLGIERRLSRGKNLSIEGGKLSGGRLGLHVRLSFLARLRPRHRGRQRRWWRWQHGPVHPVVPRRRSFARCLGRGSQLRG